MKKRIILILTILFLVVFQTTSLSFLSFKGINPNLILVFLLLLVIFKKFEKYWPVIITIGLILDFFSGLPFGTISLSLILVSFIINWLNRNIFSGTKFWISISLIILATLLYYFLLVILSKILTFFGDGQSISYFCSFSQGCLFSSLRGLIINLGYNILLGTFGFYGFKK